jgi:hypothetical protein
MRVLSMHIGAVNDDQQKIENLAPAVSAERAADAL